jgi:hypothetical protein
MRAGPLSNNQVIDLLNRYFVPVYTSNQDSGPQGHGSAEEQAEHIRIYREAMRSPCGAGAVFVFILNPEGQVIGGMDAAHASRGNALVQMLEDAVQKLHTIPGPPLVQPTPQSLPPSSDASTLVLHLTARSFRKVAPWGEVPAENWIVLSRTEWQELLPPQDLKAGLPWSLPKAITDKLMSKFYPPMEEIDTQSDRSRIERVSIRGTIISMTPHLIQARLDASLRMKRTFYARRDDDNYIDATAIGLLEFDAIDRQIRDFELVTEKATYGPSNSEEFGVALFSTLSQPLPSHATQGER